MRPSTWLAGAALWVASGCPQDREPPATGSTTTTTTGEVTSTSSGGESTAAADESTGPAWPGPADDDLLTCVRTCELPSDCCPPNTEGMCPSSEFPYNYGCLDGLCLFPPCMADTDCLGDGEVCLPVRGLPTCVLPCDGDDAPCMAVANEQTCMGMTDDGTSYCLAHCSTAGVFCGIASCDEASGVCVCSSAGQCQSNWECI